MGFMIRYSSMTVEEYERTPYRVVLAAYERVRKLVAMERDNQLELTKGIMQASGARFG